jgi:uncharacterized delta-60 repeat protein
MLRDGLNGPRIGIHPSLPPAGETWYEFGAMQPADRRGAAAGFGTGCEQIADTCGQLIARLRRQTRTAQLQRGFAFTVVCLTLTASVGAAGLDLTFGTGGKVTTDLSGRFDEIRAVTLQSDGRIVAAGVTGAAPHRDFALARYNVDGMLDPSFGDRGTVMTDFAGGDDSGWSLAIQPDGKIVVGGVADGDFALARYSITGELDSTFGLDGRITFDLGGDDRVNAVRLQADGKIVAAGVANGVDFAIVRVNADGTPDTIFGSNGRVVTDCSGGPDAAFAVLVRSDGKIVAAGSAGSFPTARFAVAQYNVDGSFDDAFGIGGVTTVTFDKDARAHAVSVLQDGMLLIGGIMNNGSSASGVFVRLTPHGAVDASFGRNGRIQTDFGGRNFASTVAFHPDGHTVVAGSDDFPPYYDFAIAQYEPDGTPDGSFNQNGAVLTEFGGNSWINAVTVDANGRIIAAGYARGDFALVRYEKGRARVTDTFDTRGRRVERPNSFGRLYPSSR